MLSQAEREAIRAELAQKQTAQPKPAEPSTSNGVGNNGSPHDSPPIETGQTPVADASREDPPEAPQNIKDSSVSGEQSHTRSASRPANHTQEFTLEEPDYVKPLRGAGDYTPTAERAIEPVFRRVPPQNIDAEKSLLGAIMLDPSIWGEVARVVRGEHFYHSSHAVIFDAMRACVQEQNGIDAVTLGYELKKHNHFDQVGGGAYLAELAAFVPTSLNFFRYAEIVVECAAKRQIIRNAVQLMETAYNGSTLPELSEQAKQVAPSFIAADALPVLISQEIKVMSGAEFAKQQSAIRREWLVRGFLARKEISLWSGKVEHGKTTLIRTLVMCVLRGIDFLERQVTAGRVLYVMLDADGPDLTYELFLKLGWRPDRDPIDFLIDPVMCFRPNAFAQFHRRLLELQPALVVIDPIGRFQKIEEKDGGFNGYGMTYAMAQFSELAKQANCHMVLLHHIPRGRSDLDDAATAGFGSIAIAGGSNARFVCLKKPGDVYVLKTSKGKGGGFEPFDGEMKLQKDPETEWVTLAGAMSWTDMADAIKPRVLELINCADEPMSANDICRELQCQRSIAGAAAKSLYKEGEIDMKVMPKTNKHMFFRKSGQGELV